MSLLFDVSPEEPGKKSKSKAKTPSLPRPSAVLEKPEKAPIYIGKPASILGRLDDAECIDESCQAQAHDIVDEGMVDLKGNGIKEPAWHLECCFCGTGQWVAVIKGHLKEKPVEFTFRDGRFAGQTIAEAATHPRGMDYLTWAAAGHPRQAVRESVRTWLDLNRQGV